MSSDAPIDQTPSDSPQTTPTGEDVAADPAQSGSPMLTMAISAGAVLAVLMGLGAILLSTANNDGGRTIDVAATAPATPNAGQDAGSSDGTNPAVADTQGTTSPTAPANPPAGDSAATNGPERRIANDPLALGSPDAPVVMVAYSDYACGYCSRFHLEAQPALVQDYVDSGVLRIEWRDLPRKGTNSVRAAIAARAAGEQGAFWQMNEAIFQNGSGLSDDLYLMLAESFGLDTDRFQADLNNPELVRAIETDSNEGQALGISGTPSFLINGTPIIGAQPIDVFRAAIEEAAAQA